MPSSFKKSTNTKATGSSINLGTNDTDFATPKAIADSYIPTLAPAGTIVDFAGSTAPTGWLLADGSTVSQSTYASLYAVIGHTYGADPGGGNFILPNAKGRVTVGKSTDTEFDALGETGGAKTVTLTSGESGVPAHNHGNTGNQSANHTHSGNTDSSGITVNNSDGSDNPSGKGNSSVNPYTDGYHTHSFTTGNVSADHTHSVGNNSAANATSAHNNLQPYITLNKIIKY
jgi:microcystin-dependent protein